MPQLVSWVVLGQHRASSKVTSVGLKSEWIDIIGDTQDWCGGKGLFQASERLFLFLAPYPWLVLLG